MPGPIRVIAWGNCGRCDDGVALALADRLEQAFGGDPDVIVQQFHQLGPELVCDLDDCRLAIFIDAHIRTDWEDVTIDRVLPVEAAALNTHHCSPAQLLALATSLGYRAPEAVMVCIRGYDMEFGDALSEATHAAMLSAERHVHGLIERGRRGSPLEVPSHA